MARSFQSPPQILPAIEPRIGKQPCSAIDRAGLLPTLRRGSCAQKRKTEAHTKPAPDAACVRAAKGERIGKLFQQSRVWRCSVGRNNSRDAAHCVSVRPTGSVPSNAA